MIQILYNYSVTPLADNEFEKRIEDIVSSVKRGAFSMPLFCLTLTPEGNPVWDKVGKMSKLYAKYRDALETYGVDSGILIQASFGHGYTITEAPFQLYTNLTDGKSGNAYCPMDEKFLEHFADVVRTLAKEKPKAIMLDDDFRLLLRPGNGCACEKHMAEFNRRAGTNFSREELYDYLRSHSKNDPFAEIFISTQRDSMIKAATVFRNAIDEIDPSIQGINCTSGHFCESVDYTNKIFAGKGNPTMVRVPNGCYAPLTVRGFSEGVVNAAICNRKLKKRGIDIILAETDTIPFNRYAKSARYLHSHFTASVLEGLKGAKHWLTRTSAFEPESGKAYRDILAKHSKMYEKLVDISEQIEWVGLSSFFVEQNSIDFSKSPWYNHNHDVILKTFERIGIPFYLSDNSEKVNFLEGDIVEDMTDSQIKEIFENSVFADGLAAKILCERGYGEYLGVEVSDWDLGTVTAETFDGTVYMTCTSQKNLKKITAINENTEELSYNYLRVDGGAKILSPAVTVLERDNGKISAVYCGSNTAEFNYMEGFAFLNESRKNQFVALLQRANALPVYCVGDDEICMKAGYINDGRLLVSVYELGIDPIEKLEIYLENQPKRITYMLSDGSEQEISFKEKTNNVYELDLRVEPLYPAILFIE